MTESGKPLNEQLEVSPEVILTRKMEYWLQVNEPVQPPAPVPAIESRLPRIEVDVSLVDPRIVGRLSDLRVFSNEAWNDTCKIISLVIARLETEASERLEESLAAISAPPPIAPKLAKQWFSCVNKLYPEAVETAIMGFFRIVWMWERLGGALGSSLEVMLAYFFKALQALGESAMTAPAAHILINLAKRWPERLCYWLDRTSSGGLDVILAMKRAQILLPEAVPSSRETLLDFAADMGWRFLDEEDMPLWRAIGRRGELLYRRLRSYSIPTPYLKLLSGILGALEKKDGVESHLSEIRLETASRVFQENDLDLLASVLDNQPRIQRELDALTETEIAVEIISLKGMIRNPVLTSREIIEFVSISGGTLKTKNLQKFLKSLNGSINEDQIHAAVTYARKLDSEEREDLTDSFFRAFLLIGRVLSGRELDYGIRNSIKRVFSSVLACSKPDRAVEILENALDSPGMDPDYVFITGSLLIRSSPEVETAEVLEKMVMASNLLLTLHTEDLIRITSGLPPFWFKTLSDKGSDALKQVTISLEEIDEKRRRGRFLDHIVSPLLEELDPEDSAFSECLSAAVMDYNRADTTSKLREAERSTLQRLFRAGNRTESLDVAMAALLKIPGLEGDRATVLLEMQRKICGELSRQEVWQEKTNKAVSLFFDQGLNSIIRAFVDYPEVLDCLSLEGIETLLQKFMYTGSGTDGQLSRWQIETGTKFFGRVFPLAVELFGKEPKQLLPFLESIAEEAVHLSQGVPAGSEFLSEASFSLEHRVIEEYTIRLESWLAFKATPPLRIDENWAGEFYKRWSSDQEAETGIEKEATRTAQFLTTRRDLRKTFVTLSGELFTALSKSSLYEKEEMIKKSWEAGIASFSAAMGSTDLLEVFRAFEKGSDTLSPQQMDTAEKFFLEEGNPRGENPCTFWRRNVFSQFCNCLINMLMLDTNKETELILLLNGFQEVIEFLGAESPSGILAALGKSLSGTAVKTTADANRIMERQLFRPLWRRRAMFRLELLVAGMSDQEQLLDNLLDRLSMEGDIIRQVSFLRWFGLLFLVIEVATGKAGEDMDAGYNIREALKESWVFNPHLERHGPFIDTVRETAEIAEEVFHFIRQKKGVVTAIAAEEISIQMRRKYRDNADSVAILLRWTLDPSREPLLVLLEDNQPLLQAASSDTELLRLLDVHGAKPEFMEVTQTFAGNPDLLKRKLKEMIARNS